MALWKELYSIDGIDLDLEEGAGSRKEVRTLCPTTRRMEVLN